jgi:predicted DNA-binding helix-hairpin-helix protein
MKFLQSYMPMATSTLLADSEKKKQKFREFRVYQNPPIVQWQMRHTGGIMREVLEISTDESNRSYSPPPGNWDCGAAKDI